MKIDAHRFECVQCARTERTIHILIYAEFQSWLWWKPIVLYCVPRLLDYPFRFELFILHSQNEKMEFTFVLVVSYAIYKLLPSNFTKMEITNICNLLPDPSYLLHNLNLSHTSHITFQLIFFFVLWRIKCSREIVQSIRMWVSRHLYTIMWRIEQLDKYFAIFFCVCLSLWFPLEYRDHNEDETHRSVLCVVCMLAISITIFLYLSRISVFGTMEPAFIRATFFSPIFFSVKCWSTYHSIVYTHGEKSRRFASYCFFFFLAHKTTLLFAACEFCRLFTWSVLERKKKHTQFSNSLHKHQQTRDGFAYTNTHAMHLFIHTIVRTKFAVNPCTDKKNANNNDFACQNATPAWSCLLIQIIRWYWFASQTQLTVSILIFFFQSKLWIEIELKPESQSIGQITIPRFLLPAFDWMMEYWSRALNSVAHIVEFEFAGLCELS